MKDLKLEITYLPLEQLTPYINNAKLHPQKQIDQIKASIAEFGMNDPIAVWGENNIIVEGHGRLLACEQLNIKTVPVIRLDNLTEDQRKAYTLAHNKLTMNTDFDLEMLKTEIENIDLDMGDFGFDDLEIELGDSIDDRYPDGIKGGLSKKYIVPPFSVLDARKGTWVERKREWRQIIGDDGSTRGEKAQSFATAIPSGFADVSLLDPVLSEIILSWFTPAEGKKVFDCFAGDTVFGYVAGSKGFEFTGIELREEQATFNQTRVNADNLSAKYICDDGRNVAQHIPANSQDLFFSCPPYYDLEVYSDKENDASNQETYEDFYAILDTAFTEAIKCLKNDRFAVIVAGDVRNKKTGGYYGFLDDIKATFKREGLHLYNELILIDAAGTAAIRANRSMKSRKVVKTHQNVLVFYKGNTKNIPDNFNVIEYKEDDLYESEDE